MKQWWFHFISNILVCYTGGSWFYCIELCYHNCCSKNSLAENKKQILVFLSCPPLKFMSYLTVLNIIQMSGKRQEILWRIYLLALTGRCATYFLAPLLCPHICLAGKRCPCSNLFSYSHDNMALTTSRKYFLNHWKAFCFVRFEWDMSG